MEISKNSKIALEIGCFTYAEDFLKKYCTTHITHELVKLFASDIETAIIDNNTDKLLVSLNNIIIKSEDYPKALMVLRAFVNTVIKDLKAQKVNIPKPIPNNFSVDLREQVESIYELLVEKNIKYGDSALSPKRIFSKASSVEQILVRIDDKISRLANQNIADDEDVVMDLIGYLLILRIAQNRQKG